MRRCSGQALVETAVLAAVFAGLLVGLPFTLVLHDVQRTSLRTARDAVWLADWDRGRSAQDGWMSPLAASVESLPWRQPRDGARVVAPFDRNALAMTDSAPPGQAGRMLEFIAEPLQAGGFRSSRFALTSRGLREARVTLRVPPVRGAGEPFDRLDLAFEQRASVLTDAWNAGGSAQVRDRVSGLVPTARIGALVAPVQAVSGLVAFIEPAFRELCIGYLDVEQVPRRRLAAGLGAANSRFDARNCP